MGAVLYTLCIFPVAEVIEFAFTALYRVSDNYGIAIIGLSFVVTLCTLPIYMVAEHWQEVERKKVASMAPEVKKIKQVFRGDERFMLLSAYYRECGYKPIYALRSSFSILIQIPFFLAAYMFLSNHPALKGLSFWFIRDLGSPDKLISITGRTFNLLPIVMTVANCISGAIYSKGHPVREKIQIYVLAAIFLVILYGSPAGLVLYWAMNNILSLVKNIFYKMRHPFRILYVLFCLACAVISGIVSKRGTGQKWTAYAIYIISITVVLVPLWYRFAKWYSVRCVGWMQHENAIRFRLFFWGMAGTALLIGVLIPLNLISTSPTEFANMKPYVSPFDFVHLTFLQTLGCYIIWPVCLYFLFPRKVQPFFTVFALFLFFGSLINTFLFSGNYGTVFTDLSFASSELMKTETGRGIGNLLALSGLFIVLSWILSRHFKKPIFFVLCVLILAVIVQSGIRTSGITKKYKDFLENQNENEVEVTDQEHFAPMFHFSRTGKNVLVIMLDRAISGFVPYIFQEDPALNQQLSGFTYYPNALSFGGHTMYGTPTLYGGYDYTPLTIQATKEKTLAQKQNEAITLLPKVFASNGYEVVTLNPPYPDYSWDFEEGPFKGMEHVTAKGINGRYNTWWKQTRYAGGNTGYGQILSFNMVRYAIFQASPVFLRWPLYDKGEYLNALNHKLDFNVLGEIFVNHYSTMVALPYITDFNDGKGNLNMMDNEMTHEDRLLQAPDYVPVPKPKLLASTPFPREPLYHVDAGAFRLLGVWFDYLKKNGVYDNTKIIIVSDHGFALEEKMKDNFPLPNGDQLSWYRALLMVKDFGSDGPLKTDDTFMTNADVPALSLQGIVADPVNPYTGHPIAMDGKKDGIVITTSIMWNVSFVNKDQPYLPISKGDWLSVHDDIFDPSNWKRYIQEETKR
ncbi:MAG: membrane protein insertase YidC [Sphaerochaetaceae bacterium]